MPGMNSEHPGSQRRSLYNGGILFALRRPSSPPSDMRALHPAILGEQGEWMRSLELLGAFSHATDLSMGQPMGAGVDAAVIALRLAGAAGLSPLEQADTRDLSLLQHAGCTADLDVGASVFGDEIAARTWSSTVDTGSPTEFFAALFEHVGAGEPFGRRVAAIARVLTGMGRLMGTAAATCEVGRQLGARLGVSASVVSMLDLVFERWDGKGVPNRVPGRRLPLPVRIVALAHDAELARRLGDPATVLTKRRGGALDPALVDLARSRPEILSPSPSAWEELFADRAVGVVPDTAVEAIADLVDLASPFLRGHARHVAALAVGAGRAAGLSEPELALLRRAALLHDIGRVRTSVSIWDRPGPLSEAEREDVRQHPYWTERILGKVRALAVERDLAASAHERPDAAGYPRRIAPSRPGRLLAAADTYAAMTEDRAWRPALSPEEASHQLVAAVESGQLDPEAVNAVLAAAGASPRAARVWPDGLTEREVEVLRLVTRGLTNKEVAVRLDISTRTATHHLEHVFGKIGVTTRAGASMYAMSRGLLD